VHYWPWGLGIYEEVRSWRTVGPGADELLKAAMHWSSFVALPPSQTRAAHAATAAHHLIDGVVFPELARVDPRVWNERPGTPSSWMWGPERSARRADAWKALMARLS
jgi:hypothetical protein